MLCNDCPRNCNVDRDKQVGFCKEKNKIRVAKVIENFMWEEPCISGEKGALAIFFSGCNLRCEFCQNFDISHKSVGKEFSPEEFIAMIKSYDLSKFSCIDLITPTHFSSLLCQAFHGEHLSLPIVWNSSGYEKKETIDKVSEFVDIFLPDLKYFDRDLAMSLSMAEDYFKVAIEAIREMRSNKKEDLFSKDGLLQSGVLIRHLVLPGHSKDSFKVLDAIKENIKDPLISIMSQFTPHNDSTLERKLYPLEYKAVLSHAEKLKLDKGFMQEFSSADENFIPKF